MLYCLLHYVYLILVFTSFFYTDMTSDDMITIHLPSSILGIAYKLGQHWQAETPKCSQCNAKKTNKQ